MKKPGAGIIALLPVIIYGVVELVKAIVDLVKTPEPPEPPNKQKEGES